MECKHCKIEMDFLPLSNAWRCDKCGRIIKVNGLGELEKQIFTVFDKRIVPLSVDQAKVLIWKSIDEMRKDFPKFKQFELPTIDGVEIDWEMTCKMMEARTIEREKWFERWLKKR